jgi:hypothetical protein
MKRSIKKKKKKKKKPVGYDYQSINKKTGVSNTIGMIHITFWYK